MHRSETVGLAPFSGGNKKSGPFKMREREKLALLKHGPQLNNANKHFSNEKFLLAWFRRSFPYTWNAFAYGAIQKELKTLLHNRSRRSESQKHLTRRSVNLISITFLLLKSICGNNLQCQAAHRI